MEKSLSRFPLLVESINIRLKILLDELMEQTREKIYELIKIENNYIWTDRQDFLNLFQKILQRDKFKIGVSGIREILTAYYSTYIDTIGIVVPKLVMYHLVTQSQNIIGETLLYNISKGDDLQRLIAEPVEIQEERTALTNKLKELERGMEILSGIN